jgi:hypothetical protein
MAIDKLIPQYLNSDTDQKLVKSIEMVDNLNVRVSDNDEGTEGVLKNVKGTEAVAPKTISDAFPTGENRVIGSVSNSKDHSIYFFLWNDSSSHGVYKLNSNTDQYEKIYEDAILGFQKFSFVDCDVIMNQDEDTLLYWTDNHGSPKKLNVDRLLRGEYPTKLINGTEEEKRAILNVAKRPPMNAPTFEFGYDAALGDTMIYEKLFQFSYQYKYNDGEISSMSPYSAVAVSDVQYKDGLITDETKGSFNKITLTVDDVDTDVKEIIVYARRDNTGNFYEIERLDSSGNSSVSFDFSDYKISKYLSLDEQNKSYDNVPQKAKTLSIVGNRLMFGNYIEGYENAFVDAVLSPVYHASPEVFSMVASNGDGVVKVISSNFDYLGANDNPTFEIDFSEVPSTVEEGTEVIIDISWISDSISVERTTTAKEYGEISFLYEDPESDNIETADYEVGNPNIVNNSGRGEVRLGMQPVQIFYKFKTSQQLTKAQFISEVNTSIESKDFYSVIDGDENDESVYDYSSLSGIAGSSATAVLAGRAGWKLQANTTANADVYSYEIFFGGAEVYLKYIWAQLGNWIVNNFTGSKKINVLESSSVYIGGLTGYNLFDGFESKDPLYKQYGVAGTSCFAGEFKGDKTYKAGAKHEFGIVYFDEDGRAGGVNKLGSVPVKHKSSRTRKGHVEIDLRLSSAAPSWAKKWMPVYGKNRRYESFLQYSTSYALAALNSENVTSAISKRIYVSMDTLEGGANSYKEQSGAKLDYKFEDGDKLRVISYDNNGTKEYPTNYTFDIVDYKFIDDEEASQFLVQTGKSIARSGWYLILEDQSVDGFSYDDVLAGNSLWHKSSVVEISKLKKNSDEVVYYGFGKTYDIVDGVHAGDREGTVLEGGFNISIVFQSPQYGIASSTDRYYVGDYVDLGNDVIIEITEVVPVTGGGFVYFFDWSRFQPATGNYNTTWITNPAAVVTFSEGDIYHRPRRLRMPNAFFEDADYPDKFRKNTYAYDIDYIEDASVSDFFTSNSVSIGKPYAYNKDAKTIRRRASITYSDAFVIDSDRLNLSSFNLSLANWTDLDVYNGGIDKLVNRGDVLTVLQESKVSQIPVGRNVIEYTNGDANVSVSKNVLGVPSYYAGNYGSSGNPESVVERFGVVYFADINSRKIIRLSADGITPISDKNISSFTQSLLEDLSKNVAIPKVVGGFDPDNDEYLFTVEDLSQSTITVGSTVYEVEVNTDSEYVVEPTFASDAVIWNNIDMNWEGICMDWEDVGNGMLFIDTQSLLIDSSLMGSTGSINIFITDSSYSFVAVGQYTFGTDLITLPSQTCGGDSIATKFGGYESSGVTIAYKHKQGVWSSKYSFLPSNYANIGNSLYSFFQNDNGLAWKHNVNETRNFIYGEQYSSMFEVVSNYNSSMIKIYQALGIEGDGNWNSVIENSRQGTEITEFEEREGHRYAMIPRDTINSTSHQIYLGVVESVNGNKITFTTPINRLPFVVGDYLKTAVGNTLSTTGVSIVSIEDRKTIVCSGIGVSVGDNVFVEHNSIIDGDPMRDVYASIKLTSNDTEPFEVHAISVHYDRSTLHNERVN